MRGLVDRQINKEINLKNSERFNRQINKELIGIIKRGLVDK